MILTPDNEYAVVLDACVLVPMCLCDTLLRLAEEPALYRPVWSDEILSELGYALENKIGISKPQIEYRIGQMRAAFPEALVDIPSELLNVINEPQIPDRKDGHVIAAAISGHANAIVSSNTKHFPAECIERFGLQCQHPDEFLINQFWLEREQVLEKLDDQAATTGRDRASLLETLAKTVPNFARLISEPLN